MKASTIMKRIRFAACALVFAVAPNLQAQEASPTCAAPVAATGEFASWNTPQDVRAAGSNSQTSQAVLALGQAARVALLPTPQVRYPVRPEQPGGSVSYGGLMRLDVTEAGTYRVALGSAAWLDLVRSGEFMESTAHGRGPDCTSIRKMVSFPLTPGHYVLQIAASGEPQTTVLVTKLP